MCHALIILAATFTTAVDRPKEQPTAADYDLPERVEVMPVFFVPKGEQPPTSSQKSRLRDHVIWCQKRYREMLGGRDTFAIATGGPSTYRSTSTHAQLKSL